MTLRPQEVRSADVIKLFLPQFPKNRHEAETRTETAASFSVTGKHENPFQSAGIKQQY